MLQIWKFSNGKILTFNFSKMNGLDASILFTKGSLQWEHGLRSCRELISATHYGWYLNENPGTTHEEINCTMTLLCIMSQTQTQTSNVRSRNQTRSCPNYTLIYKWLQNQKFKCPIMYVVRIKLLPSIFFLSG